MNPLDKVIDWHRTTLDAMRVTSRVVNKSLPGILTDRHVFFGLPIGETQSKLENSKSELDNLVVLALVAVFERMLRDFVAGMIQGVFANADPVRIAVRAELAKDMEFWNVSGRLVDVLVNVPEDIRGNVKQLIDFRNWVAHAHFLSKIPPMNAEPTMTHRRLSEFLRMANLIQSEIF